MMKRINWGNAIISIDVPDNRAPECMPQKLAALKEKQAMKQ